MNLNVTSGDVDSASPFLPAHRDFYGVVPGVKPQVGRRVTDKVPVDIDFASSR